jgi:hypothetical protein
VLSRRGRVPFSRIDNNMGNEQSDENHGDLDQLEEEELREDILRAFATEYGQTVKGKEPLPGSPPKKLPGNPAVRRTKAKRKSKKRVSKQAQGRSMDTVSSMNAKRNSKGGGGRTELGSRNKTAPNTEKEREIDKGTGEIDGEKAAFPEEETGKFVHNSPRKKAASAVISSKATRHEAHGKRTKHPNGAPAKGAKRPGAPAKSTKRPDAIATIGRFARNVIVKKEIAQRKVMQTEEENLVEDLLGEIVGIDVAILVQAFNKLVAPPTSSSSFRENKGAAQGQANGPPTPENDGGRVGKVDAAPAQSDNSKAFKMMLGDFSGDSPEKDSHAALKQWRVSLAQKRFHSSKGPAQASTAGGDGVVSAAKPSANTKLHSRGSPDRKNNKLSKSTVLRRRQMMKNIKKNNKIEMAHTALKNALRKQKDRVGQPGEDAAKKRARQKAAEGFKDALHQEQQKVGKEVEKMEILILLKRLGLRVNPLYIDRPIDFRTLEESSEIIINKFQSAKKPRKSKANSGGLDAKEKKLEAEKGKLLLLKEMEESGVDISVTTATARDLEILKKKKSQSNDRLAHVINIQRIFRKNRFRRTINTHLRTRQRSATCIQRFWHLMVFRRERRTMCVRVQRFWRNFQWVEKQSARSNVAVIRQRAISNWVGSNNSFIDPHMNASSIYNLVNSAASKIQRVRRQQLLIRRFRNIIADGLRKKMRNSSGDEFLHASRHYIRVSKMWKRSLKPVTAFKDQMQAAKGNVPAGRTREGHSGDVSEVEKYKSTWTFLESIIVEIQAFYRGHLTRRWVRKWKTAHSRDHEALLATKHVKVNVVGGKGFKKRDSFCKVYAHGIFLGKTNVCKNSTNPVWNKKPFHADFLSGRDIYLEFEVIARSKLGIQTFLGKGSIYAAKCFGNAKNTLTLVTKAGKKQKYNKFVQGSLTITVSKPANRTNQGANRRVKTARSKIVALQALLRGYLQRGKWSVAKRNSLRAIQLVQAKYRCVRLTRKYQQFRKSAVLCQTIVRGHIHQTRYIIKRGSAICLQQFVRCHLCRSHFNTMWSSTVTLQSLARRGVALKRYTQTRNCARRLQSWVRSKWANTKYKCLRRGVVLLQLRYKFNWKDYFKQFKHRIRSLQRVFRNFQIVHRARRIQTWYRHLKEGLKSVLNIYKYLKFYIMEENVARVQALFRGKRTRRTLTRMRSEDRAFRACYECLKPKLTSEIVSRYVEFERIWTNRQYYRDIHLPLIRIEIPYRMEIMETRRRESIEGGIMVEAHRNLCALKIQCRFRSFATRKRFAGSADDYEPTPENTDGDDTSVYSGREDSSDESLSERDTLSLGSEEEQQLDVDAIAITFPPGSDVWVASPRLFEAEGAYHGVVEKYETSEDGTVLYVVHFDDGDVVYDIGIGGDRLYHDDPRATPNVEDTHILEEEVEVEVEEEEEEKEEEKKEEEGGVEEGEGVEEEEEEEEEIEEVKEVEKEDVKEENNVEKEEKIGEEGIIPHGGGLEEGGGGHGSEEDVDSELDAEMEVKHSHQDAAALKESPSDNGSVHSGEDEEAEATVVPVLREEFSFLFNQLSQPAKVQEEPARQEIMEMSSQKFWQIKILKFETPRMKQLKNAPDVLWCILRTPENEKLGQTPRQKCNPLYRTGSFSTQWGEAFYVPVYDTYVFDVYGQAGQEDFFCGSARVKEDAIDNVIANEYGVVSFRLKKSGVETSDMINCIGGDIFLEFSSGPITRSFEI